MSTLATMLSRAGMIGDDEAARAATLARRRGDGVVASLVELGLAKEGQLVSFVQSKLMIPVVTPEILSVLAQPATDAIDAATAWHNEVVPVSVDDVGNLTLAMSDPTDLAAVDAVVERTRAYVLRAVAPRTALVQTLHRLYGPRPPRATTSEDAPPRRPRAVTMVAAPALSPAAPSTATATVTATATAPARSGQTLPTAAGEVTVVTRKSEEPQAPTDVTVIGPPPSQAIPGPTASPATATAGGTVVGPAPSGPVPQFGQVPDPAAAAPVPPAPLSTDAFAHVLPLLLQAGTRDEITEQLLSFLAQGFGRVILFVHTQGTLRGRDCRGHDLMVEAVRQVRIPVSGRSTFSQVIETGRPYFAPWRTEDRINRMFAEAMGGITGNVLVLPVKLGERVPVLVLASDTPHAIDPRSLSELVDAVAAALERLIRARKSRDDMPAVP